MKVRVLQKHIKAGKQGDANWCPIALALKEATGCAKVSVSGHDEISVGAVKFITSRSADRFINRFDDDAESVKPVTLDFKFYNPEF
jgi:hypothetical protein